MKLGLVVLDLPTGPVADCICGCDVDVEKYGSPIVPSVFRVGSVFTHGPDGRQEPASNGACRALDAEPFGGALSTGGTAKRVSRGCHDPPEGCPKDEPFDPTASLCGGA